jgi:hypothetical protein
LIKSFQLLIIVAEIINKGSVQNCSLIPQKFSYTPPHLPHEFSTLDENMLSFNEELNAFLEKEMSFELNFSTGVFIKELFG